MSSSEAAVSDSITWLSMENSALVHAYRNHFLVNEHRRCGKHRQPLIRSYLSTISVWTINVRLKPTVTFVLDLLWKFQNKNSISGITKNISAVLPARTNEKQERQISRIIIKSNIASYKPYLQRTIVYVGMVILLCLFYWVWAVALDFFFDSCHLNYETSMLRNTNDFHSTILLARIFRRF